MGNPELIYEQATALEASATEIDNAHKVLDGYQIPDRPTLAERIQLAMKAVDDATDAG